MSPESIEEVPTDLETFDTDRLVRWAIDRYHPALSMASLDGDVLLVTKGTKWTYEQSQVPFVHKITRIEDRFGNYLKFTYVGVRLDHIIRSLEL